jgi:hypothetical protein
LEWLVGREGDGVGETAGMYIPRFIVWYDDEGFGIT